MMPAPHHQTPSGWADDRLMTAYDAIYEALTTHQTAEDKLPELRLILVEIEAADHLIADLIRERAA